MLIEERLKELKDKINDKIPSGITVSDVEFEGPELVIYTDDPKRFADEADLIKILARDLRKRIVIRPNVLEDPEKAVNDIRAVVAENAGITDIFFDPDTGEVLIEAEKPGVVIGKNGATLREITKHIGWTPKVVRTPPIESGTVKQIRQYLRSVNEERKTFLRTIGRRIHRDVISKDQWVRVTMLGCCREVGRAAFLLSTPESRVLIDCGEKPDNSNSTPYLYVPEIHPLTQLDAVVLTHAHLDHCALIPLLYKYGYDGPVYSTPPTRDLSAMLQLDYLDVVSKEDRKIPYSSNEVKNYIRHSITLNYGSVTDIAPDIKLTFHNAGHILGSAIAHFHIGDGLYNIAFTGDFNYSRSRLFNPASNNFPRLEALFMESTYGGSNDIQPARGDAEEKLYETVRTVISRGGKVIIPAFAVGRSQEVMLALEEGMRREKIPKMKIYLDGMIREATAIHTTYPEYPELRPAEPDLQGRLKPVPGRVFRPGGLPGPSGEGHRRRPVRNHHHQRYAERRPGDGVPEPSRGRRTKCTGVRRIPGGRDARAEDPERVARGPSRPQGEYRDQPGDRDRRRVLGAFRPQAADELRVPHAAKAGENLHHSRRREQYHRPCQLHLQATPHRDPFTYEP